MKKWVVILLSLLLCNQAIAGWWPFGEKEKSTQSPPAQSLPAQSPCKLVEEFINKGQAIVNNSIGEDRERRISDLFIDYEPKFNFNKEMYNPQYQTKFEDYNKELFSLAKTYILGLSNYSRLKVIHDKEILKSSSDAEFTLAASKLTTLKTELMQGCRKLCK